LGALTNLSEVRVQQFDGTRNRDFNPLPERRLVIHLSGEVEIGTSDGSRQVFRPKFYSQVEKKGGFEREREGGLNLWHHIPGWLHRRRDGHPSSLEHLPRHPRQGGAQVVPLLSIPDLHLG